MNTKQYIESGILEAYALDALPPVEKQEIQEAIFQNSELLQELQKIEDALFATAKEGAITPPSQIKEQIWNTLANEPLFISEKNNLSESPVTENTINLDRVPSRSFQWQRAAILIALIGSIAVNFILFNQRNKMETENLTINEKVNELQHRQKELVAVLDIYNKEKNMRGDTSMVMVVLKDIYTGAPMAATVYWKKSTSKMFLSTQDMPMPPQGKQYQIWLIQNGKPVSIGMLPNDLITSADTASMDLPVSNIQAFAISLENEGGSASPTTIKIFGKV